MFAATLLMKQFLAVSIATILSLSGGQYIQEHKTGLIANTILDSLVPPDFVVQNLEMGGVIKPTTTFQPKSALLNWTNPYAHKDRLHTEPRCVTYLYYCTGGYLTINTSSRAHQHDSNIDFHKNSK